MRPARNSECVLGAAIASWKTSTPSVLLRHLRDSVAGMSSEPSSPTTLHGTGSSGAVAGDSLEGVPMSPSDTCALLRPGSR